MGSQIVFQTRPDLIHHVQLPDHFFVLTCCLGEIVQQFCLFLVFFFFLLRFAVSFSSTSICFFFFCPHPVISSSMSFQPGFIPVQFTHQLFNFICKNIYLFSLFLPSMTPFLFAVSFNPFLFVNIGAQVCNVLCFLDPLLQQLLEMVQVLDTFLQTVP